MAGIPFCSGCRAGRRRAPDGDVVALRDVRGARVGVRVGSVDDAVQDVHLHLRGRITCMAPLAQMGNHEAAGVGPVDDHAHILQRIQLRQPLPHHVGEPLALDTLEMDVLGQLEACLFLRSAGVGNLFAVSCAGVALGEGHPRTDLAHLRKGLALLIVLRF